MVSLLKSKSNANMMEAAMIPDYFIFSEKIL